MKDKRIYILAEPTNKLSEKFIDFNLQAALKTGWLREITLTEDQIIKIND